MAELDYDALVVGGGTAGMESALSLGDMGYSVLLIEREPTIGGKMILLSKVFPTLDCCSCIATPKMAAAFHHPMVTTMTSAEVEEVTKFENGTFSVNVNRKATYIDPDKCTGCQSCEVACTVAIPDQFNFDMVARRAAYISFACPTGIKAHGYISLIRSGMYEKAMELILKDTPIPGSLGRACYAPCETECTRSELEGELPIRLLKRFAADYYYDLHPHPLHGPPEQLLDHRVAVVGSGPAGLAAAYDLARLGYRVTIFEANDQPGGMLRTAIPGYRLPNDVVDRDIENVTALGVEIRTGTRVDDITSLEAQGFGAVFLSCGTGRDRKMGVDGDDLTGVVNSLDFLRAANAGEGTDLADKDVVVVGGGNVAIDSARVARRLGARSVTIQYRRSREEMPAFDWEIEATDEEGIQFEYLRVPVRFDGDEGTVTRIESIGMRLGEPDDSGRRRPVPIEGSERLDPVDLVITAIGLVPSLIGWCPDLEVSSDGWLTTNPQTMQTGNPRVFAGGDLITGPTSIVDALAQGRRAAHFINQFLSGDAIDDTGFDDRLPVVTAEEILARQTTYQNRPGDWRRERPPEERIGAFGEVEEPLDAEGARAAAGRCLDCGGCSECGECVTACVADAIDFTARDKQVTLNVGSVVVSTGFNLFEPLKKPQFGYGVFPNVITAMQMDRQLAPTRPYNTVLRPSDGKIPDNIAFVLCAGSRDCQVGNDLCSRVCCMYTIKQAQLIMGALPLADVTIYYIDIRAFGKGFEEFYQQSKRPLRGYRRGWQGHRRRARPGRVVRRLAPQHRCPGLVLQW